jgi:hypothetical protein
MLEVLFIKGRVYCDVIQVDHNELVPFMKKFNAHLPLESGTNIHQAKRHLSVHERPPWSRESNFFSVVWVDHDLIIPWKTIHQGHLLGPCHLL